jgi:hypothetical protein
MFEDTKGIIRSHRKLKKDIQVKRKRTKVENFTQKPKDQTKRTTKNHRLCRKGANTRISSL